MWATVIANEIFHHISKKSVRKRRASAYRFEMLLCDLFDFRRSEEISWQVEPPSFDDQDIKRRVKRNKLEKGDIISEKLVVSAKTLVPSNNEINVGSFSSEALFKGFLETIPQERQELGSRSALRGKFEKLRSEDNWEEFTDRFRKMVESIYFCDWILGVKGHDTFTIYTMKSGDFRDLLLSYFESESKNPTDFVNRFEAHALRVRTRPFFEKADETAVKLKGPATKKMEDIKSEVDKLVLPSIQLSEQEIDEEEFEEWISEISEEIKKVVDR